MKNYRITVNGVAYDVAVEEMGEGAATSAPAPAAAPKPAAPRQHQLQQEPEQLRSILQCQETFYP